MGMAEGMAREKEAEKQQRRLSRESGGSRAGLDNFSLIVLV